mgnify:CR=1 FL=1
MAEARDLVRDFLGSVPAKCENCGCASPKITPEGATRLYRHALSGKQRETNAALGVDLEAELEALNLGMARMVSKKKDSIGSTLSEREGLNEDCALKLVGLKPVNLHDPVPAGCHLMNKGSAVDAAHDQGYVTSACYSPNLGHHIALAFLKSGNTRIGEVIRLVSPLTGIDHDVEVVSAHFIDPDGERLRA